MGPMVALAQSNASFNQFIYMNSARQQSGKPVTKLKGLHEEVAYQAYASQATVCVEHNIMGHMST